MHYLVVIRYGHECVMAYKMPYPKNAKHPRASAHYYAITHEYPHQNHALLHWLLCATDHCMAL